MDSEVNGKDSLALKMYNANSNPTPFDVEVADCNADGKINGKDSLALKEFNVQLITALPCVN